MQGQHPIISWSGYTKDNTYFVYAEAHGFHLRVCIPASRLEDLPYVIEEMTHQINTHPGVLRAMYGGLHQ